MGKSKFLTFVLSVFPGLGHLYLGLVNRGLILMLIFFGWAVLVAVGTEIFPSRSGMMVLLIFLPLLWLYGEVDALQLCGRLQAGEVVADRSPLTDLGESLTSIERSRLWALLFSIVPGAGHMYLGWQQRGLRLMAAFFLTLFLMDWLHLSLFLFALPVIWFYSFFDTLQLVSGEVGLPPAREKSRAAWVGERQRWVGLGLIILGLLVFFERLVVPYLSYQVIEMIRTGVIAAIFIGGGLWLALGRRISPPAEHPGEGGPTSGPGSINMGEGKECHPKEDRSGSGA